MLNQCLINRNVLRLSRILYINIFVDAYLFYAIQTTLAVHVLQEDREETSSLSSDDRSPSYLLHDTTTTTLTGSQQSSEIQTTCQQAPRQYYLDLRGSSFQPSQVTKSSAYPSADTSHGTTGGTTTAGGLEQCRVLPVHRSLPLTTATTDTLWRAANPASTYTSLENVNVTMVTTAAATRCDEGITRHLGGPLSMITEEECDSIRLISDLSSQVAYLIIVK